VYWSECPRPWRPAIRGGGVGVSPGPHAAGYFSYACAMRALTNSMLNLSLLA
jgi:hypothetical protein